MKIFVSFRHYHAAVTQKKTLIWNSVVIPCWIFKKNILMHQWEIFGKLEVNKILCRQIKFFSRVPLDFFLIKISSTRQKPNLTDCITSLIIKLKLKLRIISVCNTPQGIPFNIFSPEKIQKFLRIFIMLFLAPWF